MSPAQAELVERWRGMVVEQRRILQVWESGSFTLRSNGEDITTEAQTQLRGQIASLEALIAKLEGAEE